MMRFTKARLHTIPHHPLHAFCCLLKLTRATEWYISASTVIASEATKKLPHSAFMFDSVSHRVPKYVYAQVYRRRSKEQLPTAIFWGVTMEDTTREKRPQGRGGWNGKPRPERQTRPPSKKEQYMNYNITHIQFSAYCVSSTHEST